MKDITIVTGFYDIGRGEWGTQYNRSVETYFGFFDTLAEVKNDMVIVTSENFADRVYKARVKYGLADQTKIIVKDLPEHQRKLVHANVAHGIFRNYVLDKEIPEFRNPDYSLVTNQKSQFVVDAIAKGYIKTSQAAWIDFGYCRAPKWFDADKPWEYDFGDKINMWIMRNLDDRPIFDVVRLAIIYFMGCHIVGPTKNWIDFNNSWQTSFNALLECGFTDDDQTTMLMVWRKNPELFTLHGAVDRGPGSWYFILRDFNDNHAKPVPIVFDSSVLK
jgi:protein YibB